MLELVKLLRIMSKHELGARDLDNALDHLVRAAPVVVVPRQPPLRHVVLVVLVHVVLVRREEPGPAVGQVELQHREAGCVAGGVAEREAGGELDDVAVEGFPVEVHVEVLRDVCACFPK